MADIELSVPAAKPERVKPAELVQLIVFRLGDEDYGIRIEQVKEVTVTPEVARMPKTPPFIKGIAKLPDGGIIIVLDMRKLLTPSEVMRLPGKSASS